MPERLVLVLDDLERTKIPMNLVLGYINNMLDEANTKIIVICNQEKLEDSAQKSFYLFRLRTH